METAKNVKSTKVYTYHFARTLDQRFSSWVLTFAKFEACESVGQVFANFHQVSDTLRLDLFAGKLFQTLFHMFKLNNPVASFEKKGS